MNQGPTRLLAPRLFDPAPGCGWLGHYPMRTPWGDGRVCLRCDELLIDGLALSQFGAIAAAAR